MAHPETLFQKPLEDGRELVVLRGPDQDPALLRDLLGAEVVERIEAVFELRVELVAGDGSESVTIMTALHPVVRGSGLLVVPHGINAAGFPPIPRELTVLDVEYLPLEVGEHSVRAAEVVLAMRVDGQLVLTRCKPLGGEVVRANPSGWQAFSTPMAGDPRAATFSRVDDRWAIEVASGSDSRMVHTQLLQAEDGRWEFAPADTREEE